MHPGTIFLQKKIGVEFAVSLQLTLPPGATLTLAIAPPSGFAWITAFMSSSPPVDAATGNPVVTPLFYAYVRHSMVRGYIFSLGLQSMNRNPWASAVDLRTADPFIATYVNGTALTITVDQTFAIMEISEDNYVKYLKLWDGLYNLERLLGGLSDSDVDNLLYVLKLLKPPVPLPAPEISAEVSTKPTMAEDLGKGAKRIVIP